MHGQPIRFDLKGIHAHSDGGDLGSACIGSNLGDPSDDRSGVVAQRRPNR
jgi:hypothetical protein